MGKQKINILKIIYILVAIYIYLFLLKENDFIIYLKKILPLFVIYQIYTYRKKYKDIFTFLILWSSFVICVFLDNIIKFSL